MMRLLIKPLVVLVICLVGIGFWQSWFSVSSNPSPDTDSNKVNVGFSVDRNKIRSDLGKVKERVKEKVKKLEDKEKVTEAK